MWRALSIRGLMDSARHVIKYVLHPRFLIYMTSYDVAITIHQSLDAGVYPAAWGGHRCGVPLLRRVAGAAVLPGDALRDGLRELRDVRTHLHRHRAGAA